MVSIYYILFVVVGCPSAITRLLDQPSVYNRVWPERCLSSKFFFRAALAVHLSVFICFGLADVAYPASIVQLSFWFHHATKRIVDSPCSVLGRWLLWSYNPHSMFYHLQHYFKVYHASSCHHCMRFQEHTHPYGACRKHVNYCACVFRWYVINCLEIVSRWRRGGFVCQHRGSIPKPTRNLQLLLPPLLWTP